MKAVGTLNGGIASNAIPVSTRDEALAAGQRFYFLGVSHPCGRGHVSPRYVSGGGCLACCQIANAKSHRARSEVRRQYNREWHEKNKDHHVLYMKEWGLLRAGKATLEEVQLVRARRAPPRNLAKPLYASKPAKAAKPVKPERVHKTPDEVMAAQRAYRARPEVRERERARLRLRGTRPDVKAKANARYKWMRENNPKYALRKRVSSRIHSAIVNKHRSYSIEHYLDYTIEALKQHIERQFLKGMGWHNMGQWHIDHIVPVSAFCFTTVEDAEFKACWALSNLRPLWACDNLKKRDQRLVLL